MRATVLAGLLALAGCGVAQVSTPGAAPAEAAGQATLGGDLALTRRVAQALLDAGEVSAAEARTLLHLRSEAGWEVFQAPAVPGPTDRLVLVALGPAAFPLADGASSAHTTPDAWRTSGDVAGSLAHLGEQPLVTFDLGAHPAGTTVETALRFGGTLPQPIWLNGGDGKNYRSQVAAPAALSWVGNLALSQDGLARAANEAVFASHDAQFLLETYPETPGAAVTLRWTADNFATVHEAPASLVAIHAGDTGHNSRWLASLPTSALRAGDALVYWAEAAGPLNGLVDARRGAAVADPPAPSWGEVGQYTFSKSHQRDDGSWDYTAGWYYHPGLPSPLRATPSEFQVYGANPSVAAEVYAPSLTDRADAALVGQGGFVRTEVWSPFFSGSPTGAWSARALAFRETHGNNLRFAWDLRDRNAPGQPALGAACPADGTYPFRLRATADNGKTWLWLGAGDSQLYWEGFHQTPALSASGAYRFANTRVGSSRSLTVTFTNTNNDPVKVGAVTADGLFTATVVSCAEGAACRTLAPGGKLKVTVKFKPGAATGYSGSLALDLASTRDPCTQRGLQALPLSGAGY